MTHCVFWNKTGSFIASAEHIALITPGFADGEQDTACIPALQHFVRALQEKGVQVTVFALHYPYRTDTFLWYGVTVVPLNGANSRFKRLFSLKKKLIEAFSTEHQQKPFSRIHAFWLNEATVWSVALGEQVGLPVTATAMGQDVLASNVYLKKPAIRRLKKIVTLSTSHAEELHRQTGLKSEIIHWGVAELPPVEKDRSIDLIGVGNLIPLKDYAYFLRICAALKTFRPEFKALIVGSGPEEKALRQHINSLGLEQHVQLAGQLNYEAAQELIRSARILIHPSQFESFGMVVIEALAVGTAVCARKTGIAASAPLVHLLTNTVEADAAHVAEILAQPSVKSTVYPISVTVNAYLEKVFNDKRTDV